MARRPRHDVRGRYHLAPLADNPALDAGNDAFTEGLDIDGEARIRGAGVELGADEELAHNGIVHPIGALLCSVVEDPGFACELSCGAGAVLAEAVRLSMRAPGVRSHSL